MFSSQEESKSIINSETYQSLTKKIKWTIGFGSIIGKNVFYKTIAQKYNLS